MPSVSALLKSTFVYDTGNSLKSVFDGAILLWIEVFVLHEKEKYKKAMHKLNEKKVLNKAINKVYKEKIYTTSNNGIDSKVELIQILIRNRGSG